MLEVIMEPRPNYRALYNRAFLKQADRNNRLRATEEGRRALEKAAEEARKEAERKRMREEIAALKRRRADEYWQRVMAFSKGRTYAKIEARLAKATGIPINQIRGRGRAREVAFVRQAIAYWAARRTTLSMPVIGRLMGGRDHTTILHAIRAYPEKRALEGKMRMAAR